MRAFAIALLLLSAVMTQSASKRPEKYKDNVQINLKAYGAENTRIRTDLDQQIVKKNNLIAEGNAHNAQVKKVNGYVQAWVSDIGKTQTETETFAKNARLTRTQWNQVKATQQPLKGGAAAPVLRVKAKAAKAPKKKAASKKLPTKAVVKAPKKQAKKSAKKGAKKVAKKAGAKKAPKKQAKKAAKKAPKKKAAAKAAKKPAAKKAAAKAAKKPAAKKAAAKKARKTGLKKSKPAPEEDEDEDDDADDMDARRLQAVAPAKKEDDGDKPAPAPTPSPANEKTLASVNAEYSAQIDELEKNIHTVIVQLRAVYAQADKDDKDAAALQVRQAKTVTELKEFLVHIMQYIQWTKRTMANYARLFHTKPDNLFAARARKLIKVIKAVL